MAMMFLLSLFLLIPVVAFLYQPYLEAQALRDDTEVLPEEMTFYRRFSHAVAFLSVVMLIFLLPGAGIIYLAAYYPSGVNATLGDQLMIIGSGILLCGIGLYTSILGVRDIVLYTRISPWGRPIIELSHSGLRAFGCVEASWDKISQLKIFRRPGNRGGYHLWLVLDNGSLDSVCAQIRIHSSPMVARHIAREWKISAGSFCPVPIYGAEIMQERLRVFIERYWAEATGHTYTPQLTALSYGRKNSDIKN